ncbi:hypothetical protein LAZ67_5003346 [Cordylochernes scorpioides]|uniref:Transposase Tc1-like domain-containing protein n=1 Tax=Cordylochernes scorpioides TaxID=51811 RepID=A0ABY6KKR8_9ARAC|nr:hypothetical protein LAZ67_5003346 [Cordylochernes scorpioides]
MPRRKHRSSFDQVSEFDRERIVAYRDCGLSFRLHQQLPHQFNFGNVWKQLGLLYPEHIKENPCGNEHFTCNNMQQCIKKESWCDYDMDCGDNSDKAFCRHKYAYYTDCQYDQFDCKSPRYGRKRCIPIEWTCDARLDCNDGSDENLDRCSWFIRQIAADTHLGASTVHRLWRRWLEQGNVAIYRNVGATRVTSARVDRRILRQAVAAPQATCTAILQHVQDTLDHSISTRTISRRLVANGLHSCRPLRRLPLTPPNRHQRLEWCRARSTWMTEWHRVVFSDESRFCLSSDSRRVRVWRRRGERSNPAAIVERPTVRQRGIMVWGAIAYDSRSPLLRIQGTMTAQQYVDDVLRPVTLPYLQGVPNALYQQDNARPHTARISQQALQDVQMVPWPPYSPDLSPIEHVWDIIGRRLHA